MMFQGSVFDTPIMFVLFFLWKLATHKILLSQQCRMVKCSLSDNAVISLCKSL